MEFARFFLVLAAILVAAKLFGELAERIGQPAVLGELLAGVLLGGSVLGIVPVDGVEAEIIRTLAELGVVLLLFEIGLETDLREMFRVGPGLARGGDRGRRAALRAAATCSGATRRMCRPATRDLVTAAIFIGATLTATSVGITARVLSDLGRMNTPEARIIIGAAVIDDVLGLVILSVVTGLAAGAEVTTVGVLRTLAVAVGFLVVAVMLGRFVAPRLFDLIDRMRVRYVLLVGGHRLRPRPRRAGGSGGVGDHHRRVRRRPGALRHQPVRHHRARGQAGRLDLHPDLLRQRRFVGQSRAAQSLYARGPRDARRGRRASRSSPSWARSPRDGPPPGSRSAAWSWASG